MLYDFQKKALEEVKDFNRCAFYHEMGLGKTFVGSEKLVSFKTKVNLIVCQKSKIEDWINHFRKFYVNLDKDRCYQYTTDQLIFNLTKPKKFSSFLNEVKQIEEDNLYPFLIFGVINYDLLQRRPELLQLKNFSVLFDESSMLKNEKAKRTKTALKLKANNVILLSGTPVGGKYEELWTQCRLLGWKISKREFWNDFIIFREWSPAPNVPPIKLVNGYKNVNLLKMHLKNHGANFLKSDEVLSLPEQVFQTMKVKVGKEYKELNKTGITTINNKELIADMPLKKLLYSRQICSAYNKYKLDAFEDLVNSNNDRLIVFYNFNEELNKLINLIGYRPFSIVNGKTKDLTSYEQYDNAITFIQYQAGAMGLNLQKANHIVYYSLPLSSELFEQSKKRINRIGQKKTCFYYLFICENTVEEEILKTLKERNDYTLNLFDNALINDRE